MTRSRELSGRTSELTRNPERLATRSVLREKGKAALELVGMEGLRALACLGALGLATAGCSGEAQPGGGPSATGNSSGVSSGGAASASGGASAGGGQAGLAGDASLPTTGNVEADGSCEVPEDARLEDVSNPTTIVGTGTAESCTAEVFRGAVEKGGVITFNCGAAPHTIVLDRPAKIRNDTGPKIVIDGGNTITLSGGGTSRILYMNTCDREQVWTTSHCDNQDHPQLTVQNLTFIDGNSKNEVEYDGGGAIYASGGRFKVLHSRFHNNVCADEGPDVGGAAIRVLQQFEDRPAYVIRSTFGGAADLGNSCSNGGGISSIGVNWYIVDSLFSHNRAVGRGGNPATSGTPGGGSGGAIYNDGNTLHLRLCGTRIEENNVNAHGSAIFFISNNHDGTLEIEKSRLINNHGGSWYALPGVSMHDDTRTIIDELSELSE